SWSEIVFLKGEGGLGIRDLKLWNRALVFRLLWEIFASQGSIWLAWLRHYRLKGRDLATLTPGTGSWVWRHLLKHRQDFFTHYSASRDVHFWDNVPFDKIKLSIIWGSIRVSRPSVQWFRLVWGAGSRPRNIFLSWLYVLHRFSTRDRLIKWGIPIDP
ncbi:hypothetical protein LINPERHAP2_LOCUS20754, partial [Linum perenne]